MAGTASVPQELPEILLKDRPELGVELDAHEGAHQLAVATLGGQSALLALRHQSRVAHDVGEHDGGQSALGAFWAHGVAVPQRSLLWASSGLWSPKPTCREKGSAISATPAQPGG